LAEVREADKRTTPTRKIGNGKCSSNTELSSTEITVEECESLVQINSQSNMLATYRECQGGNKHFFNTAAGCSCCNNDPLDPANIEAGTEGVEVFRAGGESEFFE